MILSIQILKQGLLQQRKNALIEKKFYIIEPKLKTQ